MILAIVVDTEGNSGTAYELDSADPTEGTEQPARLVVRERVGEFPFSGQMLATMMGISTADRLG